MAINKTTTNTKVKTPRHMMTTVCVGVPVLDRACVTGVVDLDPDGASVSLVLPGGNSTEAFTIMDTSVLVFS